MRVGLSVTSHHPGVSPGEGAGTMLERCRVAADVGLDHLSFGDQHVVGPGGQYLQGIPMLARALADWPSGRPAGLLFLLPLWPPVIVAEQIGTLAALTDAPLIVQTGIGGGPAKFAAMGADVRRRGSTTEAAIETIKRLLAGETVTEERFGIEQAAIGPRPDRPVEWWIGSGAADAAIDRAARHGDAWYVSPGWTIDELRPLVDRYRERCDEHGRRPRIALRRDVLLSDDDNWAVEVGDRLVADGYRGMGRDVLVCGGVARVVDELGSFAGLGVDDVVARTMAVDHDRAVESVRLLGAVRTALG